MCEKIQGKSRKIHQTKELKFLEISFKQKSQTKSGFFAFKQVNNINFLHTRFFQSSYHRNEKSQNNYNRS